MAPATDRADERGFAERAEQHRRELHVHCYRMLGSFEEAEDLVQETFLRAWRSRDSLDDEGRMRPWLYRIATNACLDVLRSKPRQVQSYHSYAEVPWLQPYPDRLLDELAPVADQPEVAVVERETIELAFLAMIQLLPPRQRAALILRDVLGWPAADTAELLEMSVAAANSALQRARATMQQHSSPHDAVAAGPQPTERERELLAAFIDTHQRADIQGALAVIHNDIRVTMPPHPFCYDGRASIVSLMERAFGDESMGDWRLVPAWANRQPAAVSYVRQHGDSEFRLLKIDVLRIQDGLIREITTFGTSLHEAFGVPEILASHPG